ncbi:MAG: hypothetical protein B6I31_02235 [Desulfobacteraceae bacterium 4572_19]|nr:MAG: hypothetical protein B6I31_02235 [Desulfobacteraceae bacterium 4572_19]
MKRKKSEILFGINSVYEALKAGRRNFFNLYILQDKTKGKSIKCAERIKPIFDLANTKKIPMIKVTTAELASMVDGKQHQGVAVTVSNYPFVGINDILQTQKKDVTSPFFLLLDGVGSIKSFCRCFGA